MTACLHCHHRIAQDGYGAWLDRTGTPECTSSFGDHVPCEATPPSDDPEGAGHIEVHVVTATNVVFMVMVERIDNHLHVTTEGAMPADIKVSFLRELADSIEAGIAGNN